MLAKKLEHTTRIFEFFATKIEMEGRHVNLL